VSQALLKHPLQWKLQPERVIQIQGFGSVSDKVINGTCLHPFFVFIADQRNNYFFSFSTNLFLERKALPKELCFLSTGSFFRKKVFCKKKKKCF